MHSRAVHIEPLLSMSAESLMLALDRFCGLRRKPELIYTDRGLNFVGAKRELESLTQEVLETVNSDPKYQEIKWVFCPPNTPHMNGLTERLVGATKRALKAILLAEPVKFETLITVFATAMGMLNNRPLGPISFEPGTNIPLTPNSFLLGSEYEQLGPTPAREWDYSKEWVKKKRSSPVAWQ